MKAHKIQQDHVCEELEEETTTLKGEVYELAH